MKRSIFLKVFATTLILLLLLALAFLLFSLRTIRSHYLRTLERDLENLGLLLQSSVLSFVEQGNLKELDHYLKMQGNQIKTRLTVIDLEGTVLGDSEEDPALMENHRFRPEVVEALLGRRGHAVRYSSTVKEDMLYVALPLKKGSSILGVIRASLFISDINELLASTRRDIARAVVLMTSFAFVLAFFFSRSLTRPIRELSSAARQVAAGNFKVKMSLRPRDEWKDVAASFNAMTEQLHLLLTSLENKKEELDGILTSMQEGLLVLERNGRIALANASASRIFGEEARPGKYYWEVISAASFGELIERVRETGQRMARELSLGERIFLGSATFLPSQDRLLVVLSDLTATQALARFKRELVLNVSHELRTPLTAIQGFAETLDEEVNFRQRASVEAILRNTERLKRIVDNLLLLAELEEPSTRLETETVDPVALAGNTIKIFEPKIRAKNLVLEFKAEPGLPTIVADPFLLEQLLINLVDNAVKYTDQGTIRVSLAREANGLILEVADTGIGMAGEELTRIFERFYVVDKSRSRKWGGSGLGLSIVKHIVNLHGGTIEVESQPGRGSLFRVRLPLAPPSI